MVDKENTAIGTWNDPRFHIPGGKFYPNNSNFPGLLMAIHSADQDANLGTNQITLRYSRDGIKTITVSSAVLQRDTDGIYSISGSNPTTNNPITTTFSGDVVVFCLGNGGDLTFSQLNIGNPVGSTGVGISANTQWAETVSSDSGPGGNVSVPSTPPTGANGCIMSVFRTGGVTNPTVFYAACGTSPIAYSSSQITPNVGNISVLNGKVALPATTIKITAVGDHGVNGMRFKFGGYFQFTHGVTDTMLLSAVRWMAAYPGWIYPGFAGLS